MARNSYQKLIVGQVIDPLEVLDIDLDLLEVHNLQLLVEVTFEATDATTGMALDLFYGLGERDPAATGTIPTVIGGSSVPIFGDTADTVTMEAVDPSVGTPQTKRTVFYLKDILGKLPRWLRLSFTNMDAVNAATVTIYADS